MTDARTVAYHTLGCKLNFSETSSIARTLSDHGYERVDFEAVADVYVINTCSVTANADKTCRATVRRVLSRAPHARVVMIGCYAQLKPQEIAEIPGVALVLGANEKFNVHHHLARLEDDAPTTVVAGPIREVDFFAEAHSYGDRTRSFLKVQDGCDYFCSFCTIPLARGRSRSTSVAEVVDRARALAETEVREVVLTGVNIGDFGKTPDGRRRTGETFLDLVRALDEVEGIERFRISSIEPNLLTDEIIDHVATSRRFAPHFHIPLQSGSDEMLRLMRRKYDVDLYRDRVAHIRRVMPDAAIGVDVIVGARGETEDHFLETHALLRELPVSYLHVFTYSERADTRALDIEPVVPMAERRARSKMLRALSHKKRRAFDSAHLGEVRPVLWESIDDGLMTGYTDNYIKVAAPAAPDWLNTIRPVRLQRMHGRRVFGETATLNAPV